MHLANRLGVDAGEPFAAPAMCVLVLGRDRQFKRMARLLFERRGTLVRTASETGEAVELVRRHGAQVVVIDVVGAMTASLRAAAAMTAAALPVGVVLVADAGGVSHSLRVLPKWGPFEDLFTAVVEAHDRVRVQEGSADAIL